MEWNRSVLEFAWADQAQASKTDRVRKFETLRVQQHSIGVTSRFIIQAVTDDRVTQCPAMHPQLMGSTGERLQLQPARLWCLTDIFVSQQAPAGLC